MERHNCGGILKNSQVSIKRVIGGFSYSFNVLGKKCSRCSEEVVSRDTVRELETGLRVWEHSTSRKGQSFFVLDMPVITASSTGTDKIAMSNPYDTGAVATLCQQTV